MNIILLLSLLTPQASITALPQDESAVVGQGSYEAPSEMGILVKTYLKTLGWALVGSIAMGFGLIIALTIFTFMTRKVDEWELIKQGNIPIGIILAAVVIGTSIVVAVVAQP